MAADKHFKMGNGIKTALALTSFKDSHARGAYKRLMVESQLAEEAARRASLKTKDSSRTRGAVAPEND